MKGFVVRSCLLFDLAGAIPLFVLLILVDPNRYAEALARSGDTIKRKIAEYRR